jgi:hypothetical protein
MQSKIPSDTSSSKKIVYNFLGYSLRLPPTLFVPFVRLQSKMSVTLAAPAPASPWDNMEPHCDGTPCYSQHLHADLLPGTFVLLATPADQANAVVSSAVCGVVGRIVTVVASSPSDVTVNIFKHLNEVTGAGGFLRPRVLEENNFRHQEIVQTSEIRVVNTKDIINLSFVFTLSSLQDSSTLAFTCQGMTIAFLLRFRCNEGGAGPLAEVPDGHCLPFPSSYQVRVANYGFYS